MEEITLWNPNTNVKFKLGKTLKTIRKKLKEHFIDVINTSESYEIYEVENVKYMLNKDYENSQEIIDDFERLEMGFIDDEILDYSKNMKIYSKAYNSRSY